MDDHVKRNCPYCTAYAPRFVLKNRWIVPTKGGSPIDNNDVVECLICGGIYADNIPDAKTMNDYYSEQSKKAQGYKANDWKEPNGWIEVHEATKGWITDHAEIKNNILEVGCFTGHLLSLFKNENLVSGYDPSRMGHEIAKIHYGLDTEISSRFRDTEFFRSGMKFNLIIMSHVVEHMVDIDSFFTDIRPALEDGGKIYIEVPDITRWFLSKDIRYFIIQREPMLQLNAEHVNFFSPRSLHRLMNRLGFDCMASEQRKDGLAVISSIWTSCRKLDDVKCVLKYFADSMMVFEKHNAIMRNVQGPVYVWGTGGHTQRMMQYSEMNKLDIKAFIESNEDYYGAELAGGPIMAPSGIDHPYPIIISSLLYQKEILEQIKGMGLKNQIITFY